MPLIIIARNITHNKVGECVNPYYFSIILLWKYSMQKIVHVQCNFEVACVSEPLNKFDSDLLDE